MPEQAEALPFLDPSRLERILAPWSSGRSGLTVAVEDPDGRVIAGPRHAIPGAADDRVQADIVVDGAPVARVVATGGASAVPSLGPSIEALAIALAELAAERQAHRSTEEELRRRRSEAAADTLGIDTVELAKGRRQQRSILSLVPPDVPGYDLASHYAAAREIGGDFFELFRLHRRGQPLGIVIADVTGKGLDAALLMAFSRPVMHTALNAAAGPAEALQRTNRVLVEERRGTLFITALCAILDPKAGRVRVASAGHEPPLLIPGDGGPIAEVGGSGVLLGAFATIGPSEVDVTLAPGDTLFFYTDGVTDAVDPSGARFGDDRLRRSLEAAQGGSAHELVTAVSAAIRTFQADAASADDVTIVAVGRQHPEGDA